MPYITDLHIHSKYSRATSKEMSLENLWRWAQLKGISVIGTGDFTHPKWFRELREKLQPTDNGLFRLKKDLMADNIPDSCKADVFFMLSAEVSCIYSKNGKTRKVHCILFAPDFTDAEKINSALAKAGNLSADGRPIVGLDVKELLKITLDSSSNAMLIPAHAWTPHFSVFGASSGFDSLEECFEDLTPHIYALETGLSSDPPMNWRLSALDNITLISNSDAHSPTKIGREANIFDAEISYSAILEAIKTKKGFAGTLEFFPEEGKYHYDGHRDCGVIFSPSETIKHNYLCPVCGRKLTIGVMHRVEKLADRKDGFRPKNAPPFRSIIPLPEIISEALKVGVNSKAVERQYLNLLERLGNEFKILMEVPIEDISRAGSALISKGISLMRQGNVSITPGYDGKFGKISLFKSLDFDPIEENGSCPYFLLRSASMCII